MVWSSGSIMRTHCTVELEMQEIIPMKLINEITNDKTVDGIQFNEEVVLQYIIDFVRLSDKAKHGVVKIVMAIDGAKIEGTLMHAMIGCKLVDVDSIDPNNGEKVYKNMQSDQWSFTFITVVVKDNSKTYSILFDHIFYFCNSVTDQGKNASDGTQWNPFFIPETKDMKFHQNCLGRGGTSKGPGVVHCCHLCMCTSDEITLPNQVQRVECKRKGKAACLHHAICCAEEIAKRKDELAALE
jgi:hypothetical protein